MRLKASRPGLHSGGNRLEGSVSQKGNAGHPAKSRITPALLAFIALLVVWAASPLLVVGQSSQDGPAFITAATLMRHDPQSLYPEAARGDRTGAWRKWNAVYCHADPSGSCLANHSGWLSPPSAALLYIPVSLWSPKVDLFLLRLLSIGPIIAAFALCWRLIKPRDGREQYYLVGGALVATPIVINIMMLGQNTGLMVLAGMLCVMVAGSRSDVRTGGPRPPETWPVAIAVGLSVVVATEVKLFPVVLVVPLFLTKRVRSLVVMVGGGIGLALASFAYVGRSTWRAFVRELRWYHGAALKYPFNRAPVPLVHMLVPAIAATVVFAAIAATLGSSWVLARASQPSEVLPGFLLLGAIALGASVWPHYLLAVLVVVAGYIVRMRRGWWLLPASMLVGVMVQATWTATRFGQVAGLAGVVACTVALPVALLSQGRGEHLRTTLALEQTVS